MKKKEGMSPIRLLSSLIVCLFVTPATRAETDPSTPPPRERYKCTLKVPSSISRPPLVIGHRGSAFNLPEHTLASYRLALELGADYIEPDLVPTKDGHLVAIHSVDLNITTDVAAKFPTMFRTNVTHDGYEPRSGYFVQDFTLDQIKQLSVRQRVHDGTSRTQIYDYLFPVPTLGEIIDLLHEWNFRIRTEMNMQSYKTRGRPGLYVELKNPDWLSVDANISLADLFLEELRTNPRAKRLFFNATECLLDNLKFDEYQVPPLVIQSFSSETLMYLHNVFVNDDPELYRVAPPSTNEHGDGDGDGGTNETDTTQVVVVPLPPLPPPMVLLASTEICHTEEFWFTVGEMHRLAGVGPDKVCLMTEPGGRDFMETAIEHELAVHPWTERLETRFVSDPIKFATAEEELRYLFCTMKVDGVFAENVDLAVRVAALGCPDDEENGSGKGEGGSVPQNEVACFENEKGEFAVVGLAFSFMGLFIGVLVTYWIVSARHKRDARRQLQVPAAMEGLDDGDLEML